MTAGSAWLLLRSWSFPPGPRAPAGGEPLATITAPAIELPPLPPAPAPLEPSVDVADAAATPRRVAVEVADWNADGPPRAVSLLSPERGTVVARAPLDAPTRTFRGRFDEPLQAVLHGSDASPLHGYLARAEVVAGGATFPATDHRVALQVTLQAPETASSWTALGLKLRRADDPDWRPPNGTLPRTLRLRPGGGPAEPIPIGPLGPGPYVLHVEGLAADDGSARPALRFDPAQDGELRIAGHPLER